MQRSLRARVHVANTRWLSLVRDCAFRTSRWAARHDDCYRLILVVRLEWRFIAEPLLDVSQFVDEDIKVDGGRSIEIVLVQERNARLLGIEWLVERVLLRSQSRHYAICSCSHTMDSMTTHGRLSCESIACANELFPDPELPAMPMMLVLAHGGE